MNIAFYAPMKPPGHPVPSGDRAMARMLLRALRAGGHEVALASRLRSFERAGDPRAQARIRRRAEGSVARLLERYQRLAPSRRPEAWFTYHLYHKAPDLLGPRISEALDVPYLVAEASHAPKQEGGPWHDGFREAALAMRRAARIVCLNPADVPCVRALLGEAARLERLAPFIDARASARRAAGAGAAGEDRRRALGLVAGTPLLVTVAMMREGAKLASYELLARALARLAARPWQLLIIGDGPAREAVRRAFGGFGERVRFAGQIPPRELPLWLAGCDLHLWPSVDEAWGMAILEAAAVGVASVAGDEGGVSSVLRHGESGLLARPRDEASFAAATASLLADESECRRLGRGARAKVLAEHDLAGAAAALDRVVRAAVAEHRRA